MKNLWKQLSKPIMCLAPMEAVTDTVFRRIVLSLGKPDVMFTEFVNTNGMFSAGSKQVSQRLQFTEQEQPLVAQIWGNSPELYERAGEKLVQMGFDGVDINMGCPDKHVVRKGECSALVENRALAGQLIQALKRGVDGRIAVSVKIRIGWREIVTEDWVAFLLDQGIDALTVHGRTTKEMSKVPCHWDEIGKAVAVRDQMGVDTVMIGNGDVLSLEEAHQKVHDYGVDGVMVGRGIFHDPWLFSKDSTIGNKTKEEKLAVLLKHVRLWNEVWGSEERSKQYNRLKRFYKIYVNGFEGAVDLRTRLMETKSVAEVEEILGS